jgi:hypothetical protein
VTSPKTRAGGRRSAAERLGLPPGDVPYLIAAKRVQGETWGQIAADVGLSVSRTVRLGQRAFEAMAAASRDARRAGSQ